MPEIEAQSQPQSTLFARLGVTASVPQGLLEIVSPSVAAYGCEVVSIEFRREPIGWVLRIFVERVDGNVSLDDCVHINRDVGTSLELAGIIEHAYNLEVSSPGLERPLTREEHFVRFAGQKVKIQLHEARFQPPRKVIRGTLTGFAEGAVNVVDEEIGEVAINMADVAKAQLKYEPPSNSAKSPKKKAKTKTSKS